MRKLLRTHLSRSLESNQSICSIKPAASQQNQWTLWCFLLDLFQCPSLQPSDTLENQWALFMVETRSQTAVGGDKMGLKPLPILVPRELPTFTMYNLNNCTRIAAFMSPDLEPARCKKAFPRGICQKYLETIACWCSCLRLTKTLGGQSRKWDVYRGFIELWHITKNLKGQE
jgi:hypothetical protein